MAAEDPATFSNPIGLAYHRILSDLVPGLVLGLLVVLLVPEALGVLPQEGPYVPAVLVALTILVLPAGLLLNFISFTLFWPAIRWMEEHMDFGPRARRIFEVDRVRARVKAMSGRDMTWSFVDRCENFVLSRHPERFAPYAHVEGVRKLMRGLAPLALAAIGPVVLRLGPTAWAAAWAAILVGMALLLLVYAAWLSGYYHAAILHTVYLASLVDGGEEMRALLSDAGTIVPLPAEPEARSVKVEPKP